MEKISAGTGWLWMKEGFAFYRKQPAEITTLFLGYTFLMFAISIIPVAGQILPLVLMPSFSITFMQACTQIEQGNRAYPSLLLAGFRGPGFKGLLQLGVLYLLAALLAIGVTSLIDNGFFWQIVTGQLELNEKILEEGRLSFSMLTWATAFTLFKLPFWYAAPLIAWQNMSVAKATFYSIVTVYRTFTAFIVYGSACVLVGFILPSIASVIVVSLFGKSSISILIMLSLSIALTGIIYCSFYPTYTYIFGKPHDLPPSHSE